MQFLECKIYYPVSKVCAEFDLLDLQDYTHTLFYEYIMCFQPDEDAIFPHNVVLKKEETKIKAYVKFSNSRVYFFDVHSDWCEPVSYNGLEHDDLFYIRQLFGGVKNG